MNFKMNEEKQTLLNKNILTVSELNQTIKLLLENEPLLSNIAVKGELSNYKIYPSGHHYFSLKDEGGSVSAVMFKSSASRLKFRPENGIEVLAVGRVSVYPKNGQYQLYVENMLPEGIGRLQLDFERLKEKLSKKGFFDREHKKPVPRFPKKVAVITSPAGAAVHDVIRVLNKRWPLAEVLVVPVRVQGDEAAGEIRRAISFVNSQKLCDVIICGRGGGSMEDLWAFNDEELAEEIYRSEIPIVSAVGHEIDFTISDFVSDLRAATPSNAAELISPSCDEITETLSKERDRLEKIQLDIIGLKKMRLREMRSSRSFASALNLVERRRMDLDNQTMRLETLSERKLETAKQTLAEQMSALEALNPLSVLKRAYSIVTDMNGRAINDAGTLKKGDKLKIIMSVGSALCTVDKVEK